MRIESTFGTRGNAFRLAAAAMVLATACGGAAAQSKNLGKYEGTINVSGTQFGPEVTYRAQVKVTMPITDRDDTSLTSEFLSGEAPEARVLVSQWDESFTQKSADSDGKFSSYTCSLAAPVEVPMSATGVLNVDLKAKKHAYSLVLLSNKDLAFNCKSSRTGAYKKNSGVALTLGTGAPGAHSKTMLPFTDASRLAARFTLTPGAEYKGKYGPIVQEWDFKRSP